PELKCDVPKCTSVRGTPYGQRLGTMRTVAVIVCGSEPWEIRHRPTCARVNGVTQRCPGCRVRVCGPPRPRRRVTDSVANRGSATYVVAKNARLDPDRPPHRVANAPSWRRATSATQAGRRPVSPAAMAVPHTGFGPVDRSA